MRKILVFFAILVLCVLAGCGGGGRGELLTVDFQEGQTLRYKFVSSRDVTIKMGPESKPREVTTTRIVESMEMIVSYTPVEIDSDGVTTIEAKCESVEVKRGSSKKRMGRVRNDAVNSFAGKSFRFSVNPSGKIEDYSQIDELIREVGLKAFRSGGKTRVKEVDMIGDFVASQWFLWDSVANIEDPLAGVAVGQSWDSKLSVPSPMVMRKARNVTYTLAEIRPSANGRLAVIKSVYSPSDSAPKSWPVPYHGKFQMAGKMIGMLRGYKIKDLQGEGEELFNIDTGQIERYSQEYNAQLSAFFLIPLRGTNPRLTLKQKLSMELLDN